MNKAKLMSIVVCFLVVLLSVNAAFAILIDNLDGTVTDTETGLMWLQDATVSGLLNNYGAAGTEEYVVWVDNLDFAGYDDWRLPMMFDPDGIFQNSSSEIYQLMSSLGWYHDQTGMYVQGSSGPFNLCTACWLNDGAYRNVWWSASEGDDFASGDYAYAWAVRDTANVPEPATLFLLGSGMLILGYLRKTFVN